MERFLISIRTPCHERWLTWLQVVSYFRAKLNACISLLSVPETDASTLLARPERNSVALRSRGRYEVSFAAAVRPSRRPFASDMMK